VGADTGIVTKKAKPNFKTLGKKLGKHMKAASEIITAWDVTKLVN
jgi:hypothetical protein